MRSLFGAALLLSAFACAQPARQFAAPSLAAEESLRNFLKSYVERDRPGEEKASYLSAFVDLNGDNRPEVIVYIMGRCGSGGCNMLILTIEASSYRIVTDTTITRGPIRVLRRASNGWRDLSVYVAGGGINPGHHALLRFDGKSYPTNPSVPPAIPLASELPGEVVIPLSGLLDGKLVFE